MKKFFNMVELTLAIAVVGIGMVGIMALFPVGFQASRDAMGDNYAADTAEQILSYLARDCQANWVYSIDVGDSVGNIKALAFSTLDMDTLSKNTDTWTPQANTNICTLGGASPPSYVYGIKQPVSGANPPDFTAHIKVWKSQIKNMNIGGVSGIEIPYYQDLGLGLPKVGAVRLNVEISWPIEKPYSAREKRFFCMELFKQTD